jgi:predicted SAM-dependent methyltransferase
MIKINIGCGWRNFGADWVHIDGGDYPHLDYKDITKLNFDDNTVDLIYASHVFEYFDLDEANLLLKEWKRVLKPNGTLRIAVPDFQAICSLYINKKYDLTKFVGPLYGKMKMDDNIVYHKICYDFDLLHSILENNKFLNINKYDWRLTEHNMFDDQSQAYLPHMDKENGVLISLNVECKKG